MVKGTVTALAVVGLLFCPGKEALALLGKERLKFVGSGILGEQGPLPLAISRYTSVKVTLSRPRSAHSNAPYTFTCAQWSARWLSAMRSRLPRWVFTSSRRLVTGS